MTPEPIPEWLLVSTIVICWLQGALVGLAVAGWRRRS